MGFISYIYRDVDELNNEDFDAFVKKEIESKMMNT
jgi:hypothetical protein